MPRPSRKFYSVQVMLTESEYEQMRRESFLEAEGTVAGVIRLKLDLPESPYGYKKHKKALDAANGH